MRLPKAPKPSNPEMARILDLPTRDRDEGAWEAMALYWTEALKKPQGKMDLRGVQGAMLQEVDQNLLDFTEGPKLEDEGGGIVGPKGLLGPVGVGHGKTGASFLIPEVIRRRIGPVRTLLIVPPDLVEKTERDYAVWARHFRFPRPTILSMGKLSHPSSTGYIEDYKPNVIIVDEAHRFARFESARTKRLLRWVMEHRDTVCVFMSGTLTQKSIRDYRHLAVLALRECCPIPGEDVDMELWQSLIDVGGKPDHNARRALLPLVNWHLRRAGKSKVGAPSVTKALARDAFSDRFRSTPGVVATSGSSCDAALVIRKWIVDLPDTWVEACSQFDPDDYDSTWETPDGEEVVDALAAGRIKAQLSSGYFSRWVWPPRCGACHAAWKRGEPDCPHRSANLVTGVDHEWMEARREWSAIERAIVARIDTKAGEDSPALVRALAREGKFGPSQRRALAAWEAIKPRYYTPNLGYQPPMEYVDLDPGPEWLAERAREWGRSLKKGGKKGAGAGRGIIWYSTPRVGLALAKAGFRVFGAGTQLDTVTNLRVDLPCAKIDVQGTGKNLQRTTPTGRQRGWDRNLILEFGGNGKTWEQKIGRTHRIGQVADEVHVDVLIAGDYRRQCLISARIGAEYIERTMSMRQKLRIATYGDDVVGKFKA